MGLKSKVRTHTETTEATLTTRGREILSREGKIDATKYAFSDEEIDYTLWDEKHLSEAEDGFYRLIMDTPMLEATPHRTKFNSHLLPDETLLSATGIVRYVDWVLPEQTQYQINIGILHRPEASWESSDIAIEPTTTYRPIIRAFPNAPEDTDAYHIYTRTDPPVEFSEKYIFTIENTNVVRFTRFKEAEGSPWLSDIPGSGDTIEATEIEFQPQRLRAKAATTITVQGVTSGITQVCSIETVPDDDSKVFAGTSPVDVTDPKFY